MDERTETPAAGGRLRAATALLVLGTLSLFLTSVSNDVAGRALRAVAPDMLWIARAAIPSCLVISLIVLLATSATFLRWPRRSVAEWRTLALLAGGWLIVWLAASWIGAAFVGHWIVYASTPAAIAAFLFFGPLGEELLFRGAIYEYIEGVWPRSMLAAVLLSSVLFSLHHIQLHTDPLSGLPLAQLVFTLPMGVVFGILRARSGSVWPPLLVHIATNVPAV